MDPWQSTNTDEPGDGDSEVIEIIPMDEYDVNKVMQSLTVIATLQKYSTEQNPHLANQNILMITYMGILLYFYSSLSCI